MTSGIKVFQRSNNPLAKYDGVVDSHATSNPAISDEKRAKSRIRTESLSLSFVASISQNFTIRNEKNY